ncbi:sensor histidine kinase [Acidobacteriota bacterium]
MNDMRRTKKQLIDELKELRRKVAILDSPDAERKQAEERLKNLSNDLQERLKEMNCLYGISKLREKPCASKDALFQGIVELIPPAWQYPEVACARLVLHDRVFQTGNYKRTKWRQTVDIIGNGNRIGTLEISYLEEKPQRDDGPFLKEERRLLDAIRERIGKLYDLEQAEERAKQQQQELIQLDKMAALGTLVSGVAHEINNPNNFIMLNAPILLEAWEDIKPILHAYYREHGDFMLGGLQYTEMRDSIAPLFAGILEGSKRIKNIVGNLKDFSRINKPDLSQTVDINAIVESAVALLGNQINRATKRFSVKYGTGLPKLTGNSQQLEQVVINLIQNACEALSDSREAISVSSGYDKKKHRIVVVVKDEGIGIPADKLGHIMEPFNTTKRHIGGTGLGLSVSSGIVKNHGGTLSFTSIPGTGTTATLRLPLVSNRAVGEPVG